MPRCSLEVMNREVLAATLDDPSSGYTIHTCVVSTSCLLFAPDFLFRAHSHKINKSD